MVWLKLITIISSSYLQCPPFGYIDDDGKAKVGKLFKIIFGFHATNLGLFRNYFKHYHMKINWARGVVCLIKYSQFHPLFYYTYRKMYKISPLGYILMRTLGTVTNWKLASFAFGKNTSGFQMAFTSNGSDRSRVDLMLWWASRGSNHLWRKYVSAT